MFDAILQFLTDGIGAVFTFFGNVLTGGIGLFYVGPEGEVPGYVTELGELLLLGALVGLAYWGIKFVRSMIPFVR